MDENGTENGLKWTKHRTQIQLDETLTGIACHVTVAANQSLDSAKKDRKWNKIETKIEQN